MENCMKFYDSMKNHQIHLQHHFSIPVILEHSDNHYLEYPVKGVLSVYEQTTMTSINGAVFRILHEDGSLGAPVGAKNPVFKYIGSFV